MTETSYPKGQAAEEPLGEAQWKNLFLSAGRGIVDMGGTPYWLDRRDSVTDLATVGVDSIHNYNIALLDGFMHFMDAPISLPVPPVSVQTTYEIGLVYRPSETDNPERGPVALEVWTAPGDTSLGVSRLTLWKITRKPNVALADSPYEQVRPRNSALLTVTKFSHLPTNSLVLSDTIAVVREEGALYRSAVASGSVQWIRLAGGGDAELLNSATGAATPNTLVKRGDDGNFLVTSNPSHTNHPTPKNYVDGKISDLSAVVNTKVGPNHNHNASGITAGELDNARVKGSTKAYSNTNVGSTWASVVATSSGNFGRYPSALKYKKNIRSWSLDTDTVYGLTPVKYEDRESGTTRVGFVADSYVSNLPELVEFGENGDVEGWAYMLTCVAQQVAIRDLNDRVKAQAAELDRLHSNQAEILAFLGLGTDGDGRVITNESGA